MQRWEYCVVGYIKGRLEGDYPRLIMLTNRGQEQRRIEGTRELLERDVLAQTIARLGEDGWEMVGCGNVGEHTHVIYFKRPKAE